MDRAAGRWLLRGAFVCLLLLVLLLVSGLFRQAQYITEQDRQGELLDELVANREETLENREIGRSNRQVYVCALAHALGADIPDTVDGLVAECDLTEDEARFVLSLGDGNDHSE